MKMTLRAGTSPIKVFYTYLTKNWTIKFQGEDIQHYICRQRVLKPDDTSCLDEEWTGKEVKQVDEDAELAKDLEKAKKDEL